MTYQLQFSILPGEAWFGANINDGWKLPVTEQSKIKTDTRYIRSYNQASPLWLSTKVRYLWSEAGYLVNWNKGKVRMRRFRSAMASAKANASAKPQSAAA